MGLWQVPLMEESAKLTTFIMPFGRYHFNRLPFGIASAPHHDAHLHAVLTKVEKAGITLNMEKCELSRREVKFLGHIISEAGIRSDPAKTAAVREMPVPTNTSELRSFLGMVNQLGKFIPQLAEKDKGGHSGLLWVMWRVMLPPVAGNKDTFPEIHGIVISHKPDKI